MPLMLFFFCGFSLHFVQVIGSLIGLAFTGFSRGMRGCLLACRRRDWSKFPQRLHWLCPFLNLSPSVMTGLPHFGHGVPGAHGLCLISGRWWSGS